MPPSFSGKPSILSAICSHLPSPDLSRMLRVDKECFHIAGRALYRYLTVISTSDNQISPPIETFFVQELWSPQSRAPRAGSDVPTKMALLDMVEVLDITEEAALYITNNVQSVGPDEAAVPHALAKMETLVIRSYPIPAVDMAQDIATSFGDGWAPKRLVFVGSSDALRRVLSYKRDDGAEWGALAWPSVLHIQQISPFQLPSPQTVPAPLAPSLSERLPNVKSFDVYYDLGTPNRHPRDDESLSFVPYGYKAIPIETELDYRRRVLALGFASVLIDLAARPTANFWLPIHALTITGDSDFFAQAILFILELPSLQIGQGPALEALLEVQLSRIIGAREISQSGEELLGSLVDGAAWTLVEMVSAEVTKGQAALGGETYKVGDWHPQLYPNPHDPASFDVPEEDDQTEWEDVDSDETD